MASRAETCQEPSNGLARARPQRQRVLPDRVTSASSPRGPVLAGSVVPASCRALEAGQRGICARRERLEDEEGAVAPSSRCARAALAGRDHTQQEEAKLEERSGSSSVLSRWR